MDRMSRTFWELALNCILLGIIIEIVCIFLPFSLLDLSIGLWLGEVIAIGMAVSMELSVNRSIERGEHGAVNYMRSQSILRYVFVVLAFGLVLVYKIGNPLSCFAGVMTLKVAAYLQPFTHRFFAKRENSIIKK